MYISNFCCISPAGILKKGVAINHLSLPEKEENCFRAQEPDYSHWIAPMKLRRMPRLVKMGMAATKLCFEDNTPPVSVHIGSAYCMLQESETFLKSLIDLHEEALPPTPFIQSTHNTVSGALALDAKVHGHNFTFSHRGHSFENALLDAQLFGEEENHKNQYQLLGAMEEITPLAFKTMQASGCISPQGLPAGEGVSVFKVSPQICSDSFALIRDYQLEKKKTPGSTEIHEKMAQFINRQENKPVNSDFVVFSYDPNPTGEKTFQTIKETFFPENETITALAYSGVYPTASAFGLGLGLAGLSTRQKTIGHRCWAIQNFGNYWSFWLIEKVV